MKGEPLLMLEMLSSSQPAVIFLLTPLKELDVVEMQILRHAQREAHASHRRWTALSPDECRRGSAGTACATAPVAPVPPITWLVSSIDLLQV